MEYVDNKALENARLLVPFYQQHMDDTFVVIARNFKTAFSDILKEIHASIRLTYEAK